MAIKILIMAFFIGACGREVKVSNKLESVSLITEAEQIANYQKTGVFTKGTPDQIKVSGKTYTVSKYSSHSAFQFINSLSAGTEISVVFTGGIKGNEVLLEKISKQ